MSYPDQEGRGRGPQESSIVVEVTSQEQELLSNTQAAVYVGLARLQEKSSTADELLTLSDMLIEWSDGKQLELRSNRKKDLQGGNRRSLTVNLASVDDILPIGNDTPQDQLSLHINTPPFSGLGQGAVPRDAIITVSTVGIYRNETTMRPEFIRRAGIQFEHGKDGVEAYLFPAGGVRTPDTRIVNRSPLLTIPDGDYAKIFKSIWSFGSKTVKTKRN